MSSHEVIAQKAGDLVRIGLVESFVTVQFNLPILPNDTMNDAIKYGNEAEITYYITLFKTVENNLFTNAEKIGDKTITYFLNYRSKSGHYTLFNNTELYESKDLGALFSILSAKSFQNSFQLKDTGFYYTTATFSFTTVKLIFPISLFFIFSSNLYNIKVGDMISNTIHYEKQ